MKVQVLEYYFVTYKLPFTAYFVHLFVLSFIFEVDGMARILMLLKNSLQVSARLQD